MFDNGFDPYEKMVELEEYLENQAFAIESLNRQMNDLRVMVNNYANYNKHASRAIEGLYTYVKYLENQIQEIKDEKTTGRPLR